MSPHGPEGTHKNNPITLKGIDSKAFRCFLRVAWKREKRVRLKAEEWSSVLKLANLWNFEQIKHEAQDAVFNALQNDAFAMLKLGQEFEFKDWIMRGYAILSDPGLMMPLKALASNGLSDKIPDIIKAREAMRFYTQYDLRIMTGSPAYQNRIFECFSCHTGAPQCRLGAPSYLRHIEVCDPDLEQISWCECKETLFPHPGVVVQFDDMVKLVVEEVFKDELKHY
ncbi:hypothetical protein BJ165DRAFT_1534769 [Panaeolus papilionaceus]|nr:hypothetical protein BJ165DRAFT_1534769 [Panaeolus papilionaceus]